MRKRIKWKNPPSIKDKTCKGKIQHPNKLAALYCLEEHNNKNSLDVYDCPFCAFWHIGHKLQEVI